MGGYSQAFPTIIDTILHAVAPALPDAIPAAHKGVNGPGLTCIGKDPQTGEPLCLREQRRRRLGRRARRRR